MNPNEPVIIRGYCGYLRELSISSEAIMAGPHFATRIPVYDVVLVDTKDPQITINIEGVTVDEIDSSI